MNSFPTNKTSLNGYGRRAKQRQRWRLLVQVRDFLEKPLIYLAFIWLALTVLDFTVGLNRFLVILNFIIWGVFLLDFLLEFWIAPRKTIYLRRNWLTGLAVVLPALRIFRVLRVLRTARAASSLRLVRTLSSINRGMGAVADTVTRRGLGYILIVTTIVVLVGSAAIARFESPQSLIQSGYDTGEEEGIESFGDAVWWTSMIMTTIGSDYSPKTPEGRILALLLAIYGLGLLGYVTATIASHFIGIDISKGP